MNASPQRARLLRILACLMSPGRLPKRSSMLRSSVVHPRNSTVRPEPTLRIWQTGTADAIRGVDPEEFRVALDDGVDKLRAADVDVVFMNMQYSPRTEAMLAVTAYADAMRIIALKREA